jgi:hypothetical protein
MNAPKLTLLLLFPLLAAPAFAQQDAAAPPADEAGQVVEVSGTRDPALKPYRQMLKGVDAFDTYHEKLAPKADMLFELVAPNGGVMPVAGLELNIVGDKVRIALPLAADATFVIPRNPAALEDNADLILNRKKALARWRPHIHSAGVPDNARRLGDLRLECEMSWAVMREEVSFVIRTAAAAAGGLCHAPMIGLSYAAPRPVKSVSLVSGERRQQLELHEDKRRFVVPLRDTSWNDETLVVYEFEDAPAA